MTPLLVLRPEPGASQTIAAARALGLEAIRAPLFAVEAVDWVAPNGDFDALMLTSANAVRFGLHPPPPGEGGAEGVGGGRRTLKDFPSSPSVSSAATSPRRGRIYGFDLVSLCALPAYAVGKATAAAAREVGLEVVHVGTGGAVSLVAAMRERGVKRALHFAGEAFRAVDEPGFEIERVIVYRSVPVQSLPALPQEAVVLIHSPNAGCLFGRLIDEGEFDRSRIAIAAISPAAAARAGEGWASVAIAGRPTDAALLAVAAKLCEEGATDTNGRA